MNGLNQVQVLMRAGRFADAASQLAQLPTDRGIRAEAEIIRAELYQRLGRHELARSISSPILKARSASAAHRARAEFVLGLLEAEDGRPQTAILHLQSAASIAENLQDLRLQVFAYLRLMLLFAEDPGPHAATPVLMKARSASTRLGDPTVTAALHIFLGEMEAKRGLLQNAARHTRIGLNLLNENENLWLEALAENTFVAIALMRSDVGSGIHHGERALHLARESGIAILIRASLGNLGNLHYLKGDFEQAIEFFQMPDIATPLGNTHSNALFDSIARVYLRLGRVIDATAALENLHSSTALEHCRLSYGSRHAQLTHAELLEHQGSLETALKVVVQTIDLASQSRDHILFMFANLRRAHLLQRLGRFAESLAILIELDCQFAGAPEVHGQYERVIACALASTGDRQSGQLHFERARRIYQGLHNVPGLIELDRDWEIAVNHPAGSTSVTVTPTDGQRAAAGLLQNIAALVTHAGRPELIATGLVAVLGGSGSVTSAAALSRADDDTIETLATFGASPRDPAGNESPARTIVVGSARGRTIEVTLRPRSDIESIASLNAVSLLVGVVRDLERVHAEREERLTLWPIEEIPMEDNDAVVAGKMRELMSFARKVAATNVSVLITGDSGTGKEILANAIHRFSPRSAKPFVPFNCAAIPREMLESQLFGHRRGAFTGADRDNIGLIRSAQGGTLFLDEIGDLSPDLQPKLLRFLESGEICPLGDPSPFTVDVRIIAATNSNLEELVQQGRFREDLFYRLNVIRLPIPPLRERRDEIPVLAHHFVARAAAEFGKGRVRLAEETMEHLVLYPWPGNVRQLFNEIRRIVALAEHDAVLSSSALSPQIIRATPKARPSAGPELAVALQDKLTPTLTHIEREMIRAALHKHHGQLDAAARALGISRKGLYLKRQRFGL